MTQHVKDRRAVLLAEAASLFRKKGFPRTTVRDIASAVGLQSGSLFHHFATKDDILFAVMEDVIAVITENMLDALAETETPRQKVRALIRTELEAIHGASRDAMTVLVFEWRHLSPARQKEILVLRDQYEALWLTGLAQAAQAGLTVVESFTLRRLLVGSISWTVNWFDPDGPMSLDDLAEQILNTALKT
ncbi:TetR/AcrR family transcriptional regulator [Acanthopleuribacter pedis]|uniref:TetR family transcriptional regulator n=1 Tax=Acanthopleuribacter pedis TaxID=442870 RepID=A0A8J7QAQ3_9BACT|nr:TetR/AcrR family transcriptional regulator [Acanthopleuribacter pedis]MBO1320604.1 TetR family transcriptional regulator [Acanthopleuribacter pedis]